jgi:hypothetical protein
MSTANEVKDHLTEFSDHYATLGPVTSTTNDPRHDIILKNVVIVKENRRYYLDLKENKRGRFVKMSMTMPTLFRNKPQVVIPAQGIIEIRDIMTELLDEFGTSDGEKETTIPDAAAMRADNKMFYFDVGKNRRGTFMRISEVRPTIRMAVTIPEQSWPKFCSILTELMDKTNSVKGDQKQAEKLEITSVKKVEAEDDGSGKKLANGEDNSCSGDNAKVTTAVDEKLKKMSLEDGDGTNAQTELQAA